MALKLSFSEEFAASPERVFAVLTDVDSQKHWMSNLMSVERLTPDTNGVGAQFKQTRKMFGRPSFEIFEVTAYEPGKRFGLFCDGRKGTSGKGEFRFNYSLKPKNGTTILTVDGEISGGGWVMSVIGKLFVGPMKKAFAKDISALKQYVERA